VGALEVMCRATLSCATIAEAARVVAHVMDVVSPTNRVLYEEDEGGWRIVWLAAPAHNTLSLLFHEITFVTVYSMICWLAGKPLSLSCTDFPCPMPLHQLDLRAMLPGQMRFNQPRAAIHFPSDIADLPVRREARDIAKLVRTAPAGLIEAAIVNAETSVLVRDLLRGALPTLLTLDDVAARLALSPSTLHRKLHCEGQSFQSVKDQLRMTLAHHALTRTEQPVKQIARVLGFADRASFQRTFLNWTGQTPGACRARNKSR
jgi:AraC-like DNA-binding protein